MVKCSKCKKKIDFNASLTDKQKNLGSVQFTCSCGNKMNLTPGMVHVAFSYNEKEKIKKYAKKGNTTISEFIRQAVYDKIRIIENPDLYKDICLSEERLREIQENQKKQMELQEQILERLKSVNEMLEALKPLVNKEEMKNTCETIISMLKVYDTIKIEKLEELVTCERRVIYECIATNDKLMVNENEEVYLI